MEPVSSHPGCERSIILAFGTVFTSEPFMTVLLNMGFVHQSPTMIPIQIEILCALSQKIDPVAFGTLINAWSDRRILTSRAMVALKITVYKLARHATGRLVSTTGLLQCSNHLSLSDDAVPFVQSPHSCEASSRRYKQIVASGWRPAPTQS
jgi:hypothetical protein